MDEITCEGFLKESLRNVIVDAKKMAMFDDIFPDGHFVDLKSK